MDIGDGSREGRGSIGKGSKRFGDEKVDWGTAVSEERGGATWMGAKLGDLLLDDIGVQTEVDREEDEETGEEETWTGGTGVCGGGDGLEEVEV